MIDINVIASGSGGNCTALNVGGRIFLLDAGIPFKRIHEALNFKLPEAIFITHEHKDHAHLPTVNEYLKRGIDLFMTQGTADALGLQEFYNLKIIEAGKTYAGSLIDLDCFTKPTEYLDVEVFGAMHDAAEPVYFSLRDEDDSILYVTDTGEVSYKPAFPPTKILIETNFRERALIESQIDRSSRLRIWHNHLSVERAALFLADVNLDLCEEIHLMHISKRHGDPEKFKPYIEAVVGRGINVYVH